MTAPGRPPEVAHARLDAMSVLDAPPPEGCRRHHNHVRSCSGCIDSYINRVAWHLVHPGQEGGAVEQTDHRPALDPTPCGICGAVIGEGLMTLHVGATHPPSSDEEGPRR